MIVHSMCNSCFQLYNLLIQESDIHLVKQVADEAGILADCPRLCGGKINLANDSVITDMGKDKRLREPLTITGLELFKAINGVGLPDEIPKSLIALRAIINKSVIEECLIEEIDGKFYLHEIGLSNGATLHLSGGPKGSQVLKITKRESI